MVHTVVLNIHRRPYDDVTVLNKECGGFALVRVKKQFIPCSDTFMRYYDDNRILFVVFMLIEFDFVLQSTSLRVCVEVLNCPRMSCVVWALEAHCVV